MKFLPALSLFLFITHFSATCQVAQPGDARNAIERKLREMDALFNVQLDTYNNLDSAEWLANSLINLAVQNSRLQWEGAGTLNLGRVYLRRSDFSKAREQFYRATDIFSQVGNSAGMSSAFLQRGNLYLQLGDYTKSIELLHTSLNYLSDQHLPEIQAHALALLCLNYNNLCQYEQATKYGLEAVGICEENKIPGIAIVAHRALGFVYEELGDAENAEKHFLKAVEFSKIAQNVVYKGMALLAMTDFYLENKKFDAASFYLDQLDKQPKTPRLRCQMKSALARIALSKNDIPGAIATINEGLNEARQASILPTVQVMLKVRSEIFFQTKNYEKAYADLNEAFELQDSLLKTSQISKIQMLREDHLLEQQQLKHANELSRQKYFLSFFIVISFFGVLVIFILFYFNKKIKASKKILHLKNEEIATQYLDLKQSNQMLSTLLSVISHDIRSPLQAGEAGLARLEESLVNSQMITDLRRHFFETLLFCENLLYWARSHQSFPNVILREVSVSPLFHQVLNIFRLQCTRQELTVRNNIPVDCTIWTDERIFRVIVGNLISNAIKNALPQSIVTLECELSGDDIHFKVSNVSTSDALFKRQQILEILSEKADTPLSSTSYGLSISLQMAQQLKGRISLVESEDHVFVFQLTLPN